MRMATLEDIQDFDRGGGTKLYHFKCPNVSHQGHAQVERFNPTMVHCSACGSMWFLTYLLQGNRLDEMYCLNQSGTAWPRPSDGIMKVDFNEKKGYTFTRPMTSAEADEYDKKHKECCAPKTD